MARMRWLKRVAGTSLVLAMGCQTPTGYNGTFNTGPTVRTLDGSGGTTSVPRFPATTPGTPAAKSTPANLPNPVMPAVGDSNLRIGDPSAKALPVTTQGVAKLRPLDANAAPPAMDPFNGSAQYASPPNMASLPETNPFGTMPPLPQPGTTMPPPAMPALPSIPPPLPTSPFQPSSSSLPNAPPVPNFGAQGASRQNVYPGGNP